MTPLHLGYHFLRIILLVEVKVKVMNLKPDWHQHSVEGHWKSTMRFIDVATEGLDLVQGRFRDVMIVGLNSRGNDLAVNVCKEKKQTNIRSSTSDIAIKLVPPVKLSLEAALDFINSDELVEVTPRGIRLRKILLTQEQRLRASRAAQRGLE